MYVCFLFKLRLLKHKKLKNLNVQERQREDKTQRIRIDYKKKMKCKSYRRKRLADKEKTVSILNDGSRRNHRSAKIIVIKLI